MPNMTLSVPLELHTFVKEHQEINWSEIARKAMWKQVKKMQLMDALVKESKLDEADIDELDHLIKRAVKKKYDEVSR